jgi:hypothetical protein
MAHPFLWFPVNPFLLAGDLSVKPFVGRGSLRCRRRLLLNECGDVSPLCQERGEAKEFERKASKSFSLIEPTPPVVS